MFILSQFCTGRTLGRGARIWCDFYFSGFQVTMRQAKAPREFGEPVVDHIGANSALTEWRPMLRRLGRTVARLLTLPRANNSWAKIIIVDITDIEIEFKHAS